MCYFVRISRLKTHQITHYADFVNLSEIYVLILQIQQIEILVVHILC